MKRRKKPGLAFLFLAVFAAEAAVAPALAGVAAGTTPPAAGAPATLDATPGAAAPAAPAEVVVPTEFRLFKFGDNATEKGTFKLTHEGARRVVRQFETYGNDLVIDYEHGTFQAPPGQPVPAAGFIKALELRADGLWCKVEWQADAHALLKAKKYRFFSPSFEYDADSLEITKLLPIALVNFPATRGMTPLVASARGTKRERKAMDDESLAILIAILGLPASATQAQVLTALTNQNAAVAKLGAAIGKPGAHVDELVVEVGLLRAAAKKATDDLATEKKRADDAVAALSAHETEGKKTAITAAVDGGWLPPADVAFAETLNATQLPVYLSGLKKQAEAAGAGGTGGAGGGTAKADTTKSATLDGKPPPAPAKSAPAATENDVAVWRTMGMSEAEIAKLSGKAA